MEKSGFGIKERYWLSVYLDLKSKKRTNDVQIDTEISILLGPDRPLGVPRYSVQMFIDQVTVQ